MSRYIDADACIADIQERYCKPCKEKGLDYHGCKCRACEVDDTINEFDGYSDYAIDIVRCSECKKSHIDGKTTHYLWCTEWGRSTDTFGYCERADRKE